jgi:hypothetical protein
VLLAQRVVAAVAQQRGDLAGAQRVLHAEHDRDGEAPEALRREDADGVGAALEQPARKRVRLEAELLRGGEHALARLAAQLAAAVHGLGHRARRHAGQRGDVRDGRHPWASCHA